MLHPHSFNIVEAEWEKLNPKPKLGSEECVL